MHSYLHLQPFYKEPALIIPKEKKIVFADLHIGIEKELRESGVHTSAITEKIKDKIIQICKKFKPKDIILLGDVKHNIPTSTIRERKDVKNLLECICTFGNVHIIPGNHDGFLNKITPAQVKIYPSGGTVINDIGFVHGHRWPDSSIVNCKHIVSAHTHPTVMLMDRLDHRYFEPCWVRTKFLKERIHEKYPESKNPEILIMPAFNPLCGGTAINREGVVGPLGKVIDVENADIYLLDGSYLGKVKNISN
ncbi:MAG: metallophosphoesterase [Candidatus Thermoplasmatota archaeon]|nr:metallophosphoesterase [Candidatus Thermoplasmatota archaeon]